MRERRADKDGPVPWHAAIAVEDVPAESGRHIELSADADTRAAIAQVAGVREISRLQANFDVKRQGESGLHVAGHVSATVGQNCVVTLEPLVNEVDEQIDLVFAPQPASLDRRVDDDDDDEDSEKPSRRSRQTLDGPEPLIGGVVDLGALATEFVILGLDPYPRKPGAVFEAPQDLKPDPGPFAALAGLTKVGDGR
jgi:hypothetical protein